MKANEKPMKLDKAAEFLGMAPGTLRNKMTKDEVPYHKPAGTVYFYASELNEWIKNNGKITDKEST